MMPTITDWLMVIITLVYVIATIFICWANIKSAKASKEELAEMKRQYAEENRPHIEVEFKDTLLKQREKECIIGVGQHYDLYIASNELRGNPNMKPVTGKLTYQDESGKYESDICIDLENYATFFSSTSDDPMVKELKNIKKEIEGLKRAVVALDVSKEEDKKDV